MRIEELKLGGNAGRPSLEWNASTQGISSIYGPRLSGKTAIAEFLAHVLFGQDVTTRPQTIDCREDGEAIIESVGGRFRLRRSHDGPTTTKLTVAALDSTPVDHRTVRSLTYGLPPHVLGPLCAVDFREPPVLERLLSEEFVQDVSVNRRAEPCGWMRPHRGADRPSRRPGSRAGNAHCRRAACQ